MWWEIVILDVLVILQSDSNTSIKYKIYKNKCLSDLDDWEHVELVHHFLNVIIMNARGSAKAFRKQN